MKALGFDNVLEDFISEHDDDPDAIRNAQKRIGYGTYWCAQNDWKFLYGRIDDDVRTFYFIDTYSRQLQGTMEDVYMGPLIIKTFVAHYNFTFLIFFCDSFYFLDFINSYSLLFHLLEFIFWPLK